MDELLSQKIFVISLINVVMIRDRYNYHKDQVLLMSIFFPNEKNSYTRNKFIQCSVEMDHVNIDRSK